MLNRTKLGYFVLFGIVNPDIFLEVQYRRSAAKTDLNGKFYKNIGYPVCWSQTIKWAVWYC